MPCLRKYANMSDTTTRSIILLATRVFLRMPRSPLLIAHRHVRNSMRVQPEIQMADVKPETLKPYTLQTEYIYKMSTETAYLLNRTA